MPLAARITRFPRAYDADRGAEAAAELALAGDLGRLVAGGGGSSPYLASLLRREGEWVAGALEREPEAALAALIAGAAALSDDEVEAGLRQGKRRLALLVALADLGGVWTLPEVTGALTGFADAATGRALAAALKIEQRRGRLPGGSEADGMVAFAMGKMGAGELNYSSDIDLICLFDEARHPADAYAERRSAFVRATRRMTSLLNDITAEGYVFRTDLRLRPDPSVTPVCLSMDAAESYYEALGRTWERAVWIKARPAAGDLAAGNAFLERLRPFVWRRHLDFVAIRDAHDMRLRIRDHKATHGTALERRNVKLGVGGIREIEFFTQTRQLIAGGRDPSLRVRGTVEGLARLAAAGWVPPDHAETLSRDYGFLREVEHRLQMVGDAQTHLLPGDAAGFDRLAALMGRETAEMRDALAACFDRVAGLTEDFFAPPESGGARPLDTEDRAVMAKWRGYPALRSPRSVEIFDRLAPALFERVARTADRERTLRHLEDFIGGLPAGVQIFSLFEANPPLIDLVVDIVDSSLELARYLGGNAEVFDAVIAGRFFAPWPGGEALAADLAARLGEARDYERQLDAARQWQKDWHFRVGVHLLRGLVDPQEAGRAYADIAGATIGGLWPCVLADFARKHGAPPGRGAAVIGMGSLGAGLLTAASDLDLIVVYDAEGSETSQGRPLAARQYYARLTQGLVTALTAPTAAGRLYQVDMRLRPSGRQGPVATSLGGFAAYQRDEAWTWEHLALTRARVIAGDAATGERVAALLRDLLEPARPAGRIVGDTADMRRRLVEAQREVGPWEAKAGPGRLLDMDLAAAASALVGEGWSRDFPAQLAAGGLFTADEREVLVEAHALLWSVQAAARLLTGGAMTETAAETPLVQGVTGAEDADELARLMQERAAAAAAIIDRAMPAARAADKAEAPDGA